MVGVSLYILADTFFISASAGANGLTALNLALPLYSAIFAVGAMLGNGSATAFALEKSVPGNDAETYFSHSVMANLLISIPFVLVGIFMPEKLLALLGGDDVIVETGYVYVRTFLSCTPFFLLNSTFTSFVRNDGAPNVAMAATLISCLFNIVFDYVLMFPCGLGMFGAALATGLSPAISIAVTLIHFFSKKNTIRFRILLPNIRKLVRACRLGIGYFVSEISGGISGFVFNKILLGLVGNVAVAAYGIVANISVVGTAIFSGVAQGLQPMASEAQGTGDTQARKAICRYSLKTGVLIAATIILLLCLFAREVVEIFNSEHNAQMASLAVSNLRLYVLGFLPASVNIILCGYFGAIGRDRLCSVISISRGVVAIVLFAWILSSLFGIVGVWIAYPVTELFTLIMALVLTLRKGL
jgi:putative MATE family efflux protein